MNLVFELSPWVAPAAAARQFGVPDQTVRTWMRRGHVESMCLLDGTLVVYWPSVCQRVNTRRVERMPA